MILRYVYLLEHMVVKMKHRALKRSLEKELEVLEQNYKRQPTEPGNESG